MLVLIAILLFFILLAISPEMVGSLIGLAVLLLVGCAVLAALGLGGMFIAESFEGASVAVATPAPLVIDDTDYTYVGYAFLFALCVGAFGNLCGIVRDVYGWIKEGRK